MFCTDALLRIRSRNYQENFRHKSTVQEFTFSKKIEHLSISKDHRSMNDFACQMTHYYCHRNRKNQLARLCAKNFDQLRCRMDFSLFSAALSPRVKNGVGISLALMCAKQHSICARHWHWLFGLALFSFASICLVCRLFFFAFVFHVFTPIFPRLHTSVGDKDTQQHGGAGAIPPTDNFRGVFCVTSLNGTRQMGNHASSLFETAVFRCSFGWFFT